MKSLRILLAGAGLLTLAGLAYVAQRETEASGANMVGAAGEFVDSLKAEQKKKATYPFGTNPADVMKGPRKGLRALAPAEDLAKDLFAALSDEQRKVAHQPKHFPEPGEKTLRPKLGEPVGVVAKDMTAEQKTILARLLE